MGLEPAERHGDSATSALDPHATAALDQATAQVRAPWAASIAGLLFAAFFTTGLLLLRNSPLATSTDDGQIQRLFIDGHDWGLLLGALYLLPFAGIMFLWFIAVVRDQIGEREDQFFATVFFGSGLLFVAGLFATAAVSGSIVVRFRYLALGPPTASEVDLVRSIAYALSFAVSTRAAAVFLLALSTVGLRSGTFPRWLVLTGYLLGVALMLVVSVWDWVVLILPAWVAVVSLYILRRERARARRRTTRPAT